MDVGYLGIRHIWKRFHKRNKFKGISDQMKRFLIIILNLMLVSALYGDAFKLMGGLNLSKYTVSPKEESTKLSYKMGLWVGSGFEFDLTEHIFLEFDLLLVPKGNKVEYTALPDIKANYNLKEISFPVLTGVKFKGNLPFYILGGAELSMILSHVFVKKTGEDVDEQDLKENTKTFDFGLVFGCGFEVKIRQFQSFFIEGRYHLGFSNVFKDSGMYGSAKTNTILFVLGIKSY